MDMGNLPTQLREHQDKILTCIDGGEKLLEDGAARDVAGCASARWELARILGGYQVFKHLRIYDPAIMEGTPRQAAAARRLKVDCIALSQDFRGYIARWGTAGSGEQWTEYRLDTLSMLRRIRTLLARERREVDVIANSGLAGGLAQREAYESIEMRARA
jgi:hypothetical protein